MNAERLEAMYAAQAQRSGFAAQLTRAIREHFEKQMKQQEQQLTFLAETQRRKILSHKNAVEAAAKQVKKSIDSFLP